MNKLMQSISMTSGADMNEHSESTDCESGNGQASNGSIRGVLRSSVRITSVPVQDATNPASVSQCLRYAEDLVQIYEAEKKRRAELKKAQARLAVEINRRKRLERRLRTNR